MLHVVPEFLGNRAPFADPHARAVIAGLGMERDLALSSRCRWKALHQPGARFA
ncbi:FGGY-family carbohydrate kinase [Neorhizobium galegae]|uniref:FGGY-family carbohydrate kinase n=1 Tax=Neorhizobium galegae TaxID=399 RepID=UPI003F997263